MFAYTLTPNAINLFVRGKPWTIDKTHINYSAIVDMLKDKSKQRYADVFERALLDMLDVRAFIARVTEGRVQVSDDTVLFSGKKVHGVIRDRLLAHLSEGFDIHPLARFLDKLMDNPTESSRDDLYLWLEHSKMPITADGDFLAYKYVRDDYASCHDGTTMHNVGNVVEMPREQCDTSRHNTCSTGLHFCSYDYTDMAGNGTRKLVLKINPRDVTAIPSDYHNAKGRACRYEVIAEVEQEQKLPPLVSKFGTYAHEEHVHVEKPDVDHWDHEGCGCEDVCEDAFTPPPIPENPCAEIKSDMLPRSVTGDDRIYDQPLFKHKNGPAFAAADVVRIVKEDGQREFSRQFGVPRSTLQGWLRKAQAWLNKNKRAKKK
jgi:hypothetical protein